MKYEPADTNISLKLDFGPWQETYCGRPIVGGCEATGQRSPELARNQPVGCLRWPGSDSMQTIIAHEEDSYD